MRLRGRFTLWFVLAAILPVAAASIGTREILSRNYRASFRETSVEAANQVKQVLSGLELDVTEKVKALADRDNPFIGGLLQEILVSGQLGRDRLQLIRQKDAPSALRLARLDALYVLDSESRVIAAPHYRPARDETLKLEPSLIRDSPAASYGFQSFMQNKEVESLFVAQAARRVASDGHNFVIVGASVLRNESLSAVRQKGLIDIRLLGLDSAVLIPSDQDWSLVSSNTIEIPLNDSNGKAVAKIEIGISEQRLQSVLARVTLLAGVLGVAALLLMIGLGYFVSRRITGHLDDLVVGAQAVAHGNLSHRVPVRTGDEIGKVASALNTMVEELSASKERLVMAERVAAWQEIARRIAHEIKNPLTPIQMAIETLRKTHERRPDAFNDIFDESTQTVLEETGRLKRIVSEFSEFARMPPLEKQEFDLNELVKQTVSLYKSTASIGCELGELPKIYADKDRLSQVLINLIENARAAVSGLETDSEGLDIQIETEFRKSEQKFVVSVQDKGPGIAPEVKDKIFTPYFTTKHTQGGSGLGLAIVHRIVAEHGGRISAGNAETGGAFFLVELPSKF